MRILQIIDSLETGGSERMAVNYANALATELDFSGLVATRKEGGLLDQLDKKVSYLFLNKKYVIDLKAVFKLRKFIKKNKITIIQAHSSSFFTAIFVKIWNPKLKLIWHDHYGNSDYLDARPAFILKIANFFFDGIIVVNTKLLNWVTLTLKAKNTIYLPNFTFPSVDKIYEPTVLKGNHGKKILMLANLREQKDHFFLLDIASNIKSNNPDWTFHLVGKDFNDSYSEKLKKAIIDKNLSETIFIYGSKKDVTAILTQIDIAILTSKSEGLPVALLEYGYAKKSVVVTNVGEISSIIDNGFNGFLVNSNAIKSYTKSLTALIESESMRSQFGNALSETIEKKYSKEAVIVNYLSWIKTTL